MKQNLNRNKHDPTFIEGEGKRNFTVLWPPGKKIVCLTIF